MDIQTAIEILETYIHDDDKEGEEAFNVAIKALEKQAFFENEVGNIRDWFVDNKDCLLDSARSVSDNWFDDCKEDEKMDKVDLDFMIEDLVDEIQKGILNVLDSYKTGLNTD